ncbi:hypothetical protein GQ457_12G012560 [Hibiscus cannabinus]
MSETRLAQNSSSRSSSTEGDSVGMEGNLPRQAESPPPVQPRNPVQPPEGFDNLLELDDKGDVSARDNGSGLGRFSRLIQTSAERLAELLAYV